MRDILTDDVVLIGVDALGHDGGRALLNTIIQVLCRTIGLLPGLVATLLGLLLYLLYGFLNSLVLLGNGLLELVVKKCWSDRVSRLDLELVAFRSEKLTLKPGDALLVRLDRIPQSLVVSFQRLNLSFKLLVCGFFLARVLVIFYTTKILIFSEITKLLQ